MRSVLSVISIFALITISTIHVSMLIVHAEDPPYCAAGEGKNGVSVKICSVDKEKCEENAKEHEISASCKETD
ncbi:MAG TPA: hypothetical protein VFR61_07715 [Nitrososphaeraceae archaeon]|nr:hypothetical protein [Nitrososphaeraceae archaeon]